LHQLALGPITHRELGVSELADQLGNTLVAILSRAILLVGDGSADTEHDCRRQEQASI
jgi:hypothetical protein